MTGLSARELYQNFERDELIVLPPGWHRLDTASCSVKNGNSLLPTFRIVGGPNAGKRVLAGQLTLSEKAAGIFFRNLKGFGIGKDIISQLPGESVEELVEAIAPLLPGRRIDANLTVRPWNDEDRNQIVIGGIKLVGITDSAGVFKEIEGAPAAPAPAETAPATSPSAAPSPAPTQTPQAPPPPAAAPATPPPAASPAAPATVAEPAPAAPAPAAAPVPPPPAPEQAAAPPPPPPPVPESPVAPPPPAPEQAAQNGSSEEPSAGVPPVPPVPGAGKKTPF